jgi:hypothetical protein
MGHFVVRPPWPPSKIQTGDQLSMVPRWLFLNYGMHLKDSELDGLPKANMRYNLPESIVILLVWRLAL